MNLDDLKPFWEAYKQEAQTEKIWQEADIQLIIQSNASQKMFISQLRYWLMNTSMYLLLILCTNGC
ncbi:MAG: hypothetical protein MUE85_14475 [Microscillaceae bacterium]|jgi:hypothetical protein|nr:hypothetical protein [Microscillaceae bacterium]